MTLSALFTLWDVLFLCELNRDVIQLHYSVMLKSEREHVFFFILFYFTNAKT